MRTGTEAAEYGAEIQRVVRYLGVGNGNMQEGSLRCDVNVSVRPIGQSEFGTKVMTKTLEVSQLLVIMYSMSRTFYQCYDMMIHQYNLMSGADIGH